MRNAMILTALGVPGAIAAQAPHPGSALAGVSFLVGDWETGRGQVSDTGGTATGMLAKAA